MTTMIMIIMIIMIITTIIIVILEGTRKRARSSHRAADGAVYASQDSSKGGAVETGCSGLHYIIGCFTI